MRRKHSARESNVNGAVIGTGGEKKGEKGNFDRRGK